MRPHSLTEVLRDQFASSAIRLVAVHPDQANMCWVELLLASTTVTDASPGW